MCLQTREKCSFNNSLIAKTGHVELFRSMSNMHVGYFSVQKLLMNILTTITRITADCLALCSVSTLFCVCSLCYPASISHPSN